MQPIAAARRSDADFDFPNPTAAPPLITLDLARWSMAKADPQRLNFASILMTALRCSAANGNGKTTLARLLAAQLTPMEGR